MFLKNIMQKWFQLVRKSSLEFDIDWAHDEVINYSYEIIKGAGLTQLGLIHRSKIMDEIDKDQTQDVGIHPNFVPNLLSIKDRQKPIGEVFAELMGYHPNAKVMKSHSLVDSSIIQERAKKFGITHDNNVFIPDKNINLKPWVGYNGVIRLPLRWEDDTACLVPGMYELKEMFKTYGLKIFGFHPIHVYLNTENLDRYEVTRQHHNNPHELWKHRNTGYGTEIRLREVISYINEYGT